MKLTIRLLLFSRLKIGKNNASISADVQYFIDLLKPLVVTMYHQFHTQKLYIRSTDYIKVFCMDLNIGGDLIPTQH